MSFPGAPYIKTPSKEVSCQYEAKIKQKNPENSLKHCYTVHHRMTETNKTCEYEEDIRGDRAYAANHHTLKSKIIKRSAKTQIYKMLIRPVVIYGSETWTLTKSDGNLLRIFERKILHKIYGPIEEGDI